jgi:hypothetical protein
MRCVKILGVGSHKTQMDIYERKILKYFKILKVFRMQLFLYYYFILAIFFENIYSNSAMLFVASSILAMTFYMAFQVYLIHQYSFDNDIRHLTNKIK